MPAWPADSVERWSLDRLTAYERNSRTHSDLQVAQIAASMREWGWTNPILVDEAGTILAGHGRVAAARSLGYTEAPVMVARGWSDAQKRAYIIADNKLALNAGWDDELLGKELLALQEEGADLVLLGFNDAELGRLLAPFENAETPTDWDGMPEFQQDDQNAWRTIHIHFVNQAGVDEFARLIGQEFTEKTKFAWFPKVERLKMEGMRYEADEP